MDDRAGTTMSPPATGTSETADPADVVARLRSFADTGRTQPLSWRLAQLDGLSRLLAEHGHELEAALAADLGKAPTEAHLTEIGVLTQEIAHTRANLRRWLEPQTVSVPWQYQPARASLVLEPLGVMLVMAPWNYPVLLLLAPLVGALAAGNAVLLKPSELAPRTAETIARLLPRFVEGVAVVTGGPARSSAVLAERFDHIVFTGSARVGRIVMTAAARHLTPVTLELGGKSPAWVDSTTDLPAAARRIAWAKLVNAGQTCVAPDYLLAPPEVAEELAPLLSQEMVRMYGTDAAQSPDFGRIITTEHAERLQRLVSDSVAAGARTVLGGPADPANRFVPPTILADVTPDSPAMAEEIFGPVLPIVPVAGIDDAIGLIRSREKPLALYAFTDDSEVRTRLLRETSSGALGFDVPLLQAAIPTLPFGGVGGSGMGAYHGEASVRAFSHAKPVVRKPLLPDTLAAIRPPFSALRQAVARRLL